MAGREDAQPGMTAGAGATRARRGDGYDALGRMRLPRETRLGRKVARGFALRRCSGATAAMGMVLLCMVVMPNLFLIWAFGTSNGRARTPAGQLVRELAGVPPASDQAAQRAMQGRAAASPPAARPRPATQRDFVETTVMNATMLDGYMNRNKVNTLWALSSACYDTGARKFVFHEEQLGRLPKYVQDDPKYVQATAAPIPTSAVGRWVPGLTVLGREMHLDQTGAHFYFFMLPVTSLLYHVTQELKTPGVSVAFEEYNIPESHSLERQFADIVMKDIPPERRLSLEGFKESLVCFEELLSVGNDYSASIRGQDDLEYLKTSASKVEMQDFVKDCADPGANHAAVGILNRRVFSRKISNIHQLKVATKQVFGANTEVVVFDSPNVPCEGTDCMGYTDCSELNKTLAKSDPSMCRTTRQVGDDIRVFNNLTFFISVHGAANMNYVWLPKGSTAVEIFPYAISDFTYKKLSELSGLEYIAFHDSNQTTFKSKFASLGDGSNCWGDNDCRRFMKQSEVYVTVDGPDGIKRVLYEAVKKWKERCKVKS